MPERTSVTGRGGGKKELTAQREKDTRGGAFLLKSHVKKEMPLVGGRPHRGKCLTRGKKKAWQPCWAGGKSIFNGGGWLPVEIAGRKKGCSLVVVWIEKNSRMKIFRKKVLKKARKKGHNLCCPGIGQEKGSSYLNFHEGPPVTRYCENKEKKKKKNSCVKKRGGGWLLKESINISKIKAKKGKPPSYWKLIRDRMAAFGRKENRGGGSWLGYLK